MEPQYRPQNILVRIIGTPKKVPLIWGNPHIVPYQKPESQGSESDLLAFAKGTAAEAAVSQHEGLPSPYTSRGSPYEL